MVKMFTDYEFIKGSQHDRDLRRKRILTFLSGQGRPQTAASITKAIGWRVDEGKGNHVEADLKILMAKGSIIGFDKGRFGVARHANSIKFAMTIESEKAAVPIVEGRMLPDTILPEMIGILREVATQLERGRIISTVRTIYDKTGKRVGLFSVTIE
jgi:hypothetical protein